MNKNSYTYLLLFFFFNCQFYISIMLFTKAFLWLSGRNSLSTIHNSGDKPVTISKSFTNTKKEELMKIIKDAKQKLENVSYFKIER